MKKLIEVALPLDAINAASAREKSIRHGHPSTLHLWWSRKPLATTRAVLFASMVDDPSEHPEKFPTEELQNKERERLFDIIKEIVIWENSGDERIFERAHNEIKNSCGEEIPAVFDPFAGGGSIPLEAQRLGLKAIAADLNPVAVMINKAMIELPATPTQKVLSTTKIIGAVLKGLPLMLNITAKFSRRVPLIKSANFIRKLTAKLLSLGFGRGLSLAPIPLALTKCRSSILFTSPRKKGRKFISIPKSTATKLFGGSFMAMTASTKAPSIATAQNVFSAART